MNGFFCFSSFLLNFSKKIEISYKIFLLKIRGILFVEKSGFGWVFVGLGGLDYRGILYRDFSLDPFY